MWKREVRNQGNNDVPGEYPSTQISCHHPKPSCTLSVTIPALFPSFMKQVLTSQDHILGRTYKKRRQLNVTQYRYVKMLLQLCARHIKTMMCLQMSHLGVNAPGQERHNSLSPHNPMECETWQAVAAVRHVLRWSETDWMCHRAAHYVCSLGHKELILLCIITPHWVCRYHTALLLWYSSVSLS